MEKPVCNLSATQTEKDTEKEVNDFIRFLERDLGIGLLYYQKKLLKIYLTMDKYGIRLW